MLHKILFLALTNISCRKRYLILVAEVELCILGPSTVDCAFGVSRTNFDGWLNASEELLARKVKFMPISRPYETFRHLSHLHHAAWLQATFLFELGGAALENMIVIHTASSVAVAGHLHYRPEVQALAFQLLD